MADAWSMNSITDAGSVAANAVATVVMSMINVLPSLIAATVVFVVGWIIAVLISRIFEKILKMVKLEEFLEMHKLQDALGSVKLSNVLSKIVKIYVILVFLEVSAALVSLGQFSTYIYTVLIYAPVLIGAALVIVAAALTGEYVKTKLLELGKSSYLTFVARGAKFVIVLMGVITGLNTVGFDTSLVNSTILTIVQAMIFGLGLAFGIAFGLGGQDDAKDLIKKMRKNVKL